MGKRGPKPMRSAERAKREERRRQSAIGAPLTKREIVRFWSKVNKRGPVIRSELGPCWLWTGATANGYGQLRIRSRTTGAFVGLYAHRIALWITTGVLPSRFVLHACDNRPCVNPRHVRAGTAKDNAHDAIDRGRFVFPVAPCQRGEANNAAKLTEEQVREIKYRIAAGNPTAIARDFGVTREAISSIRTGRTWKHVS